MFPPGRGSRDTKGNLVREGEAKTAEEMGPKCPGVQTRF